MSMSFAGGIAIILVSCAVGFVWGLFNWWSVSRVNIFSGTRVSGMEANLKAEDQSKIDTLLEIGKKISEVL